MASHPTAAVIAGDTAILEAPLGLERRSEPRRPLTCDLWMVDHYGSTVLRCHCLDVSKSGMRLRVPLGYGVAEGQRYELRSHFPGVTAGTSLGLVSSRWATVVRTQFCLGDNGDYVDVGVVLDVVEPVVSRIGSS